MRNITTATLFIITILFLGIAEAANFTYEADKLPWDDGWNIGDGSPEIASLETDDGRSVLHINGQGTPLWVYRTWDILLDGWVNSATFVFKNIESSGGGLGAYFGISMIDTDGDEYHQFYQILPSSIVARNGPSYSIDTTAGYNTYTAMLYQGKSELWINGELVLSNPANTGLYNGVNGVQFGAGSSGKIGNVYWDYVEGNQIDEGTLAVHVDVANTSGIEDGSQEHPFNTIQEGIDAASDGATVLVADGIYTGEGNKNLDFQGKNIIVTSVNGAESTIIDCEGDGRGFYFYSGEDESSVVDGFTIQNGKVLGSTSEGGGIRVYSSSPKIINNIITGNLADRSGGGIGLYNSSPKIINNIITNNSSDAGGGISCWDYCSPEITNNVIAGNEARRGRGGAIYCETSSFPTITHCTITANTGYGIYCYDNSSPAVINTIFWNNVSDEIYLSGSSTITINFSDIKGGWEGEGNINADPLFVDPYNGDYHLQAGSPCIDAGDPNSPKDPDGTRADIGALYYDQSGVSVPTTLEKVSGDNQAGFVGTTLPNPLVVRVLDQMSNPMEGVIVTFETSGDTIDGAIVNPTFALTDVSGKAQTILTLGTLPGEYNVTVSVEGLEPVIFTATAIESERPIIFSIYPNYGYVIGGTEITIRGSNFQDGATVTIGGRLAQDVTNPEETFASIISLPIDITDEATEDVQLNITLDEGTGATTEIITFPTSGMSLAQIRVEAASQTDVLRIIIQTAINNTFGAGKITVNVSGSETSTQVTFTTIAIGVSVRLTIEQLAGSDILFSEPITSSGGLAIHATTPYGTLGPKDVVVANPDGNEAILHNGFFYIPITGDVSGDGTVSAYDAALILQFVVGIIDKFPVDSPIGQAAQKFVAGEITIEELDRILQNLGYPSVFKLLVIENQLLQNFPNPFNPETWIPFKLAQNAFVSISIYDTKGQLIRTIALGKQNAGIYVTKDRAAYWDGQDSLGERVASGIYFYTLQVREAIPSIGAGEFRATRKMVIMK